MLSCSHSWCRNRIYNFGNPLRSERWYDYIIHRNGIYMKKNNHFIGKQTFASQFSESRFATWIIWDASLSRFTLLCSQLKMLSIHLPSECPLAKVLECDELFSLLHDTLWFIVAQRQTEQTIVLWRSRQSVCVSVAMRSQLRHCISIRTCQVHEINGKNVRNMKWANWIWVYRCFEGRGWGARPQCVYRSTAVGNES